MSRQFDGVDDVIKTPTTGWGTEAPWTVAFWVYVIGTPAAGTNGVFFAWNDVGDGSGALNIFLGLAGSSNQMIAYMKEDDGTRGVRYISGAIAPVVTIGQWHWIVSSNDGTPTFGTTKVWVDGVQTTSTSGFVTGVNVDNELAMGGRVNGAGAGEYLNGYLAHVQGFKRELTTNEHLQIQYMPGSVRRDLIGYWPLWGATVEPDYSGQNNRSNSITGTTVSQVVNPPVNAPWRPPRPNLYYSAFVSATSPAVQAAVADESFVFTTW